MWCWGNFGHIFENDWFFTLLIIHLRHKLQWFFNDFHEFDINKKVLSFALESLCIASNAFLSWPYWASRCSFLIFWDAHFAIFDKFALWYFWHMWGHLEASWAKCAILYRFYSWFWHQFDINYIKCVICHWFCIQSANGQGEWEMCDCIHCKKNMKYIRKCMWIVFLLFYVCFGANLTEILENVWFPLILQTCLFSGGHPMAPRGLLGAHLTIFDNLMKSHRILKMWFSWHFEPSWPQMINIR